MREVRFVGEEKSRFYTRLELRLWISGALWIGVYYVLHRLYGRWRVRWLPRVFESILAAGVAVAAVLAAQPGEAEVFAAASGPSTAPAGRLEVRPVPVADPKVNGDRGRALALEQARWEEALPLLAAGDDPGLRRVANAARACTGRVMKSWGRSPAGGAIARGLVAQASPGAPGYTPRRPGACTTRVDPRAAADAGIFVLTIHRDDT